MVVRLYGICNKLPVEFKRQADDTWVTQVPKLKSGEYYVSLTAVDEAGNESHWVDVLLIYSILGLTIKFIEPHYECHNLGVNYLARLIERGGRYAGNLYSG